MFLTHGWRTGAILEEVEVIICNLLIEKEIYFVFQDEINVINSEAFQKTIQWVIYFKNKTRKEYLLYSLFFQ